MLMMRHPSVVPRREVVVIPGLIEDARNNALALCRAYGFVLRHVRKPAGVEHLDIDRLVALLVKHSVERAGVCRVECAYCAVGCNAGVARSPEDVTGALRGRWYQMRCTFCSCIADRGNPAARSGEPEQRC